MVLTRSDFSTSKLFLSFCKRILPGLYISQTKAIHIFVERNKMQECRVLLMHQELRRNILKDIWVWKLHADVLYANRMLSSYIVKVHSLNPIINTCIQTQPTSTKRFLLKYHGKRHNDSKGIQYTKMRRSI
jgi:hypothetical protein